MRSVATIRKIKKNYFCSEKLRRKGAKNHLLEILISDIIKDITIIWKRNKETNWKKYKS